MYCSNCGNKLNDKGICENCRDSFTGERKVRVTLTRLKSFAGSAVNYKVFVDGVEVAKLGNGKSKEIMLSPGVHNFSFDMWSASNAETITIPNDCQEFYIDTILEMGAITNKISIVSTRTERDASNTFNNQYNGEIKEGKMTGTAISGLIFGLIGIFFASVPLGIVSISLGASALKHVKVFPQDKGKVLAILSIILGVFDFVFGLIAISMLN